MIHLKKPKFFISLVTWILLLINAGAALDFLTISDIHLNKNQKHVMTLEPSGFNEDNDMDLQSLFKLSHAIKQNIGLGQLIPSPPAFVIYLGDIVGHQRKWDNNRTILVEGNERVVYSTLQELFPATPIISIFGNNDSFEKNYGKFTFKGMSPYETAVHSGFENGFLSTGKICNDGTSISFPCISSQNRLHGCFSIKIQKKLLLIGLNTVIFSPFANAKPQQANIQMKYLKRELELADANDMSVLIAMHIPVGVNGYDGSSFWKKRYQDTFLKLIRYYHNRIIGVLVSHTHMEEFKIIRTPGSSDIGEFFTAGMSTSHGNSPSLKVFELQNQIDHWVIHNYITYQFHDKDDGEIVMSKYYDFANTYCESIPNLVNINSCLSQIQFNQTISRFTVGNPNFDQKITSPQSFYVN